MKSNSVQFFYPAIQILLQIQSENKHGIVKTTRTRRRKGASSFAFCAQNETIAILFWFPDIQSHPSIF